MIEYSDILKRKIRKDKPISELGINTFSKIKDAIENGTKQEALDLLDYLRTEWKGLHDLYCDWTYADLTYVAEKLGEEEVPRILKYGREVFSKAFYSQYMDLSTEGLVIWYAEQMRAHRCGPGEKGDFLITEEKDRYVMGFNPCGSGGRMRRIGEVDKTPPRTGKVFNLGVTKKAYPWSWGKVGVPYYCIHCCVFHEILPIEWRGYPIKITEYSDDPMAPCYWYFYKDPALIPDHYFTRIGKKKDPSKFKK